MSPTSIPPRPAARLLSPGRVASLDRAGVAVLRYGVAFLLVSIGGAKFFAFEAEAIQPLVANSPFLAWTLDAFGLRGASALIGAAEILIGLAMASRRWWPAGSAAGSALGALTFLTTLSFLFSTPGALSLRHPSAGFLLKDVVLLGACLLTCAEALRAARAGVPARAPGAGVAVARGGR